MRTLAVAVVVLSAAGVVAGVAAAFAAPPTGRAGAAPPCRSPDSIVPDRWTALPTPSGVTTVSVQQLDQDPCVLIAADSTGQLWRTTNAGANWSSTQSAPAVTRLWSERLQPRAGGRAIGLLLAAEVPGAAGAESGPRVYSSRDDGVTFAGAEFAVGVATPLGPVEQTIPLRMDLADAATAVHYLGGDPKADVYVAGRVVPSNLSCAACRGVASLLKSTDGGHTFRSVAAAQQLTVSAIAINPTSQEEIWVNDTQPGGRGGGAWVSYDGGASFNSACCPEANVRDIAVSAAPDGGIVVLLATDAGLKRSVDDGKTWDTIADIAFTRIRTPADDPSTMLATTATGVLMSSGPTVDFRKRPPGLPGSCEPHQLRRNDRVPSTFLVDCGGRTYRLLLTTYAGSDLKGSGGADPGPAPGPRVPEVNARLQARPLTELARWRLPGSNSRTGTIAFDGRVLYYDRTTPGEIGLVRASDGAFLGTWRTGFTIVSLTVDLRRNQLIVTTSRSDLNGYNDLYSIDLRTRKVALLGIPPTKVPSYDSYADGLSWIAEYDDWMWRRPRTETNAGTRVCSVSRLSNELSTFVASGDGGGYLQLEDDATMYRIDRKCRVLGTYSHRVYSESTAENDAMACDTQSYFPQPAIWLRDSQPETIAAYGVPFGYCPMPSTLTLVLPSEVLEGARTLLCVDLVNATNGNPGVNRGVEIAVSNAVVGHGQTDANGRTCVPYRPGDGFVGPRKLPVTARFAGDSALYPSSARGVLSVLDATSVAPVPDQRTVLPPPPPALTAAVPANPLPNPGPVGAPAQAPAPIPANAPAGQAQPNTQPVAQGVVVPQRQQQPQLVLARAASEIGLENQAMTALRPGGRPSPPDGATSAGLLAMCSFAVAGGAKVAAASAVSRRPAARSRGRDRTIAPNPRDWR